MTKKVAVILSGCGYLDGAEIRESVLTLLHLDTLGAEVEIFAPNKEQHHVIDHLNSNEASEKRNLFHEAARIARGEISPLEKLEVPSFDCLVIPGGFGVAKNLCTFAFKGSAAKVDDQVEKIIKEFYQTQKPIGALCIAPALVSLCLGYKGINVTIGTDKETASEIEKTGAKHSDCQVQDCVVDKENKIVTTPAYMFDSAKISDISEGISKCIKNTLALC